MWANLGVNNITISGYSMGGQWAGLTGTYVQQNGPFRIGKIYGKIQDQLQNILQHSFVTVFFSIRFTN